MSQRRRRPHWDWTLSLNADCTCCTIVVAAVVVVVDSNQKTMTKQTKQRLHNMKSDLVLDTTMLNIWSAHCCSSYELQHTNARSHTLATTDGAVVAVVECCSCRIVDD